MQIEPTTESDQMRDSRGVIIKALAQRTSNRVPWYKPIGVKAADAATSAMLESAEPVPADLLRSLELPARLNWGKFAGILRSTIPT